MRIVAKLILVCLPLLSELSRAQEPRIVLDTLRVQAGQMTVDFHMDSLLTAPIWSGMERGMTSAARFRVQLWRKRGLFLNSLVAERDYDIKTTFDPWEQQFIVKTWEERRLTKSRAYVREQWERHRNALRVDSTQLHPKHRYYVVIEVRFEPVSRESLQEVRGWLAGEMKGRGRRDSTAATEPRKARGLQDRMLNFVVDITGLGEQVLSLKTRMFRWREGRIMFEE